MFWREVYADLRAQVFNLEKSAHLLEARRIFRLR